MGWLKVVFAVTVALDATLIAWLAQNYDTARRVLVASGFAAALVLAVVVVYVTRLAYRRLNELECVMEWTVVVALAALVIAIVLVAREAATNGHKGRPTADR